MTTVQKLAVTGAITAAVGVGIYQAKQAHDARAEVQRLQQQQTPLEERNKQLQNELYAATNRFPDLLAENSRLKGNLNQKELLKLRGEVTRLRNEANDESAMTAKFLLEKIAKLKARLAQDPDAVIPEMQFLGDQDWQKAAGKKLESEADFRRALSDLRSAAEETLAKKYQAALRQYLDSNEQQFPTNLLALQPYFQPPIDEEILQRWKLIPAQGEASQGFSGGDWVLTQTKTIDETFDARFTVGLNGIGTTDFYFHDDKVKVAIALMQQAYYQANAPATTPPDRAPTASELSPYADTPEKQAVIAQMMLRESAQ